MTKCNRTNSSGMTIAVALLFLVDFVTFLAGFVSVPVLKVFVYGITLMIVLIKWRTLSMNSYKFGSIWRMIGLYLFLLFIRLLVDFVIPGKGFFLYKTPSTILFFFVMTMVFPYVVFKKKNIQLDVATFCLICGFFMTMCLASSLKDILNGKIVAATTGGQYDAGAIDIISYGHYGLSLVFLAVYIWMFLKKRWQKYLAIVFALIGLSGIVLSGSRSPIVALFVCSFLFIASRYKKWYIFIPIVFLFIIMLEYIEQMLYSFNDWLSSYGIGSFTRIVESLFAGDSSVADLSSGRNAIFSYSLWVFVDNLVFGYAYLLPDNSYVHNLLIENYMALGVFGGTLFLAINIIVIKRGIYVLKKKPEQSIYVILFFQYLILGFFSSTTIANAPYWLFLFIVLNIYDQRPRIPMNREYYVT